MNKLNEILKVLGLTINEEFILKEKPDKIYKINKDGDLLVRSPSKDIDFWTECSVRELINIITGKTAIIKRPWEPNPGKCYYVLDWNTSFTTTICCTWHNLAVDRFHYLTGNCFKTEKEALEKSASLVELYKKKYAFNDFFVKVSELPDDTEEAFTTASRDAVNTLNKHCNDTVCEDCDIESWCDHVINGKEMPNTCLYSKDGELIIEEKK